MIITIVVLVLATSSVVHAQWNSNPAVNTPVCTAPYFQEDHVGTTDGAGGAIFTWLDNRQAVNTGTIYAQRVDSNGYVQWTTNGVDITGGSTYEGSPQICSDDAGGAIIVLTKWWILGPRILYAQRVNGSGTSLWTAEGIPIGTTAPELYTGIDGPHAVVKDGKGGAIIAWFHYDYSTQVHSLVAAMVDSTGSVHWQQTIAVPVRDSSGTIAMTTDDAHGAILAWQDSAISPMGIPSRYILSQRVDSNGAMLWTSGGVVVSNSTPIPSGSMRIVRDLTHGAIVVYPRLTGCAACQDEVLWGQRIDAGGFLQWGYGAVIAESTSVGDANYEAVSDEAGGVIVAWWHIAAHEARAERLSPLGARMWNPMGLGRIVASPVWNVALCEDGAGGAIIALHDTMPVWISLYAQRINSNGISLWNNNILVSAVDHALHPPNDHPVLVPSNIGGAIIAWQDTRNYSTTSLDIYCNRAWAPVDIEPFVPGPINFGNGVSMDVHSIVPADASFDVKVVEQMQQPNDCLSSLCFNSNHIFEIVGDRFWTIDPLNMPPGTSFLTDITFIYDPGKTPGPPSSYRIASRELSGGVFDIPTNSQIMPGPPIITIQDVSHFSEWAVVIMSETTEISLQQDWNLVSLSVRVHDHQKTSLFPTATSDAYKYSGGYQSQATLENGTGYWMKFAGSSQQQIVGAAFIAESIDVNANWNIIGGISSPVVVSHITSNPPGMITTSFFGYAPGIGYSAADTLKPGHGYWVKVNQIGKLIVSTSPATQPGTKIRIVPTGELPPPPPKEGNSNLRSSIPNQFGLEQNYPNPFNPTTDVRYCVPVRSRVRLEVYNTLGQRIAVLVDEPKEAGYYVETLHAASLPSAIYFYRLLATRLGDNEGTMGQMYVSVRKMLLLK